MERAEHAQAGASAGQAADRGATVIADRAVRRIVARAAEESLGRGGTTERAAVVRRGASARVSLDIGLSYPADTTELGSRVQDHVSARTAELTGLTVSTAAIRITRLRPGADIPRQAAAPAPDGSTGPITPRARRRAWSARRLPAALLALAGAALCGALLYDALTSGGDAAVTLQEEALDRLAGTGYTGARVTTAGACVALLGVWLIVIAMAPGARRRLPMAAASPDVRAELDRGGAQSLLRDAALDAPGVTAARVRVHRRMRVGARVTMAFGDPGDVRTAVTARLDAALLALGTARPGRLRVRVVRDRSWRTPDATGTGTGTGQEAKKTGPHDEAQEAQQALESHQPNGAHQAPA
ncbi:DUF6286 domain-containing protein [Streptomyces sp. H27-C3]|uniref:DUF6286 domain-containing Asp23/Gls24 family envelope stress response protein n=1 Tax=Streptomyces sp. H27-C3 TaxID=3046305 RepID=UPI0024BBB025|nr:DUF6286 domain-containing protein [Streptomyces sp. H27-C3]MDJ0463028.1 DUF6286 domain-containing protein [Streptomyces sp. H27-C3]